MMVRPFVPTLRNVGSATAGTVNKGSGRTIVHLKTPPNATSSPNTTAVSSFASAILPTFAHEPHELNEKVVLRTS